MHARWEAGAGATAQRAAVSKSKSVPPGDLLGDLGPLVAPFAAQLSKAKVFLWCPRCAYSLRVQAGKEGVKKGGGAHKKNSKTKHELQLSTHISHMSRLHNNSYNHSHSLVMVPLAALLAVSARRVACNFGPAGQS